MMVKSYWRRQIFPLRESDAMVMEKLSTYQSMTRFGIVMCTGVT